MRCPVSYNGEKFQHPDRETIARILFSRRKDETELYFNYRSEYNEIWDADRLRRDWHYRAAYPKPEKGGLSVEL
jgi:hypothetical protein